MKDRQTDAYFTNMVPTQGVDHPHGAQVTIKNLEFLGHSEIDLKSDTEAPGKALWQQVNQIGAHRTMLEDTPMGSSQTVVHLNGQPAQCINSCGQCCLTLMMDRTEYFQWITLRYHGWFNTQVGSLQGWETTAPGQTPYFCFFGGITHHPIHPATHTHTPTLQPPEHHTCVI